MKWVKGLVIDGVDPSDVIDFTVDWRQELQEDSIASQVVTGVSLVTSASFTGNVAKIFVSSCQDGVTGTVRSKNTTTNAQPRTFERTFSIKCENQ